MSTWEESIGARVGDFKLTDANTLDNLEQQAEALAWADVECGVDDELRKRAALVPDIAFLLVEACREIRALRQEIGSIKRTGCGPVVP